MGTTTFLTESDIFIMAIVYQLFFWLWCSYLCLCFIYGWNKK